MSGDEMIRALQKLGYEVARQKGSHVRLRHASRHPVTVPRHRELKQGTVIAICRDAGIDRETLKGLV